MTTDIDLKVHRFERAGLGLAPFRVVGAYVSKYQAVPGDPSCPVLPGSSCDYCGQAIARVYRICGADGREFKVGSECVRKTHDKALISEAKRSESRHRREQAVARCAAIVPEAKSALARPDVRAALASMPDPNGKGAPQSLLTWAEWCLYHAGRTGKTKAAKIILAHATT